MKNLCYKQFFFFCTFIFSKLLLGFSDVCQSLDDEAVLAEMDLNEFEELFQVKKKTKDSKAAAQREAGQ